MSSAGSREQEEAKMSADALRSVRARIERGWSQDADARAAGGEAVRLGSPEACSWSLVGAFALAATDGIPMNHVAPALRAIAEAAGTDSLVEWNDDPMRTHEEVLDALDAALLGLESESS
jgi:hypothetical protein